MNNIEVLCLIVLMIFFMMFIPIAYYFYKKSILDRNKYRLFKVRDSLTFLVITDKITEDNYIYETYYNLVNSLIHNIKKFNLKEIIKIIKENPEIVKEVKTTSKKLQTDVEKSNNEVKKVVSDLLITINQLLIENSVSLLLIIHLAPLLVFHSLKILSARIFSRLSPTTNEAYKIYKSNNNFCTIK